MRRNEVLRALPVMLGVPLVGSETGLRNLLALPGIDPRNTLAERFRKTSDLRAAGRAFATELAQLARSLGVAGIHVMPFGVAAGETAEWIQSVQPARQSAVLAQVR